MGKDMKESGRLVRPWYRSPVTEKGGKRKEKKVHGLHGCSKKVSTRWTGSPWVKVTCLKTLVSSRNRSALVSLLYSLPGFSSMESKPGHGSGNGFQSTAAGLSVSYCPSPRRRSERATFMPTTGPPHKCKIPSFLSPQTPYSHHLHLASFCWFLHFWHTFGIQ